jgi:hypothetical protein
MLPGVETSGKMASSNLTRGLEFSLIPREDSKFKQKNRLQFYADKVIMFEDRAGVVNVYSVPVLHGQLKKKRFFANSKTYVRPGVIGSKKF